MKYYRAEIFLLLFLTIISKAQIEPGARQIALANSTVAVANDAFALFNNPAGLEQLTTREVGLFYSPAPFGLKQLANAFAVYAEPFNFGTVAFGIKSYGFELYKETSFNFSFSKTLYKKYLLGIGLIVKNLNIKNYGTSNRAFFRVGFVYFLYKFFHFGFAAENLRNTSFVKEYSSIPVIVRTGLSYTPLKNATLSFQIEKDLERNFSFSGGLEYRLFEIILLRLGIRTEPDTYTAGIGIKYSFFQLDYAIFTHPFLGLTHQAGLIVRWQK